MIGIIIQARMGSTRLPGKILKTIGNKTLLEHIVFRLKRLKTPACVVIATTDKPEDDVVERFCMKNNVECFRGSELNVLNRYYKCAQKYKFSHIVRMTADNPFPDVEELDKLIALHIKENNAYTQSFSSLPIGVGAEIFSFEALEEDNEKASLPHHFEHVDEYILEHLDEFKNSVLEVEKDKNYPEVSLTVDTVEDYKKACYIVEEAKEEYITTQEAVKLCLQYA